MIAHVFPPEMMYEREKQLIKALLDCAGVFYDVNFTKNKIMGNPIQIVDGVEYPILELIGKPAECPYTEIIDYWSEKMPEDEVELFLRFSHIDRIKACYAAGEHVLTHKFWTYDVLGNRMLAQQVIRLYRDNTNDDLLGLVYVSNGGEQDAMMKKEALLTERYESASNRAEFLEMLAHNMPGGYHRCGVGDGFPLEFVSDSFLKIVGWTREQLREELDNRFINVVAPEDRAFFMSHEPELIANGQVNLVYRIHRRDGTRRWVQDATMHVEQNGMEYYQCVLSDITEFVHRQEEITRRNVELSQEKMFMETMEKNMPSGYHRCKAEPGCPFTYIGHYFTEIVGFTREEIKRDFDNMFVNLIWPEDEFAISAYNNMSQMSGNGNLYDTDIYRVKHKDGGYRWVTDSTMFVDLGENSFLQGTISDITPQIEEMERAKRAAEASNRAKSTFLFNASHDIRTPMNAIQGFAHIIKEHADDPELVRDTVDKITQAGNTLMTLMNDILELARIEQGKEEVNSEVVNLYEKGKNLYEMFAGEMAAAGIAFYAEGDAVNDTVLCDNLKLTRIMMNMLSNAIKFTPAGGTVTFGGYRLYGDEREATYRFFVRDTGIGMSKEFQTRAFEQFEQERSSTASGVTGSGLGLAIIKKLVELMGGEVGLESELGKGTEISATLTFPLVREEESESIKGTVAIQDMKGKRVLLVEDNSFNREITRYILEELNLEVEDAENGAIAVDKVLQGGAGYYDVILMDIQMPVMDGYLATKEIRNIENRAVASVPILAMTANAFTEDKQRCLEVGMDGHIAKPIERDNFLSELYRVLGGAQGS